MKNTRKNNDVNEKNIFTIDLNFQGKQNTIGVFLILHSSGGALVECGPGSTIPILLKSLARYELKAEDITDVLLTHIHLDHAGSAGWWAKQGARIHVHHIGKPHLVNPEKLISSAKRIYGERMDELWGEFLPVPESKINPVYDGDEIPLYGLAFTSVDTPGHANHHMSYILDGVCFSGDVGGVRLQGVDMIRLPTVPPEFQIDKWRESIRRLQRYNINAIAPTHFGIHKDAKWHLNTLDHSLDEIQNWMESIMPSEPSQETVRTQYSEYIYKKSLKFGLSGEMIGAFDLAISSQMSADGIYRYWMKHRTS